MALVTTLKELSAVINAKGLEEYPVYSDASDVLREK
jgi:hypothetical protein